MANRLIFNETSYHGRGAIEHLIPEIMQRGYKKALIVTDQDLFKLKLVNKVTDLLDEAQLDYEIYSEVLANPSIKVVKDGLVALEKSKADYIIAFGGGSPIDSAKAIGIIATNPEYNDVVSLEGVAPTKNKSLPIIALPTTAGTAAEATINYVITDENNKRKFVCVDPHDIPVLAIVDSSLMEGMPFALSAATGLDALTHAIEGFTTAGAWELPDTLNLKAINLIINNIEQACINDVKAREAMALAQYTTGMAFSNVGLGLVHGMAHPLGAVYDIPHGVANALLLPYVLKYNIDSISTKIIPLAHAMNIEVSQDVSLLKEAIINKLIELTKNLKILS